MCSTLGSQKSCRKIKAKNVVYFYMRDEGSIHSHLGVPFFQKIKKNYYIIRMNWVKGAKEG